MKRLPWQKVYTPDEDMLNLRVKNTLAALSEGPERRTSMKKVWAIALACVLAVGTVGASSLFAPEYDAVRLANQALAEEYGITEEMQTYFNRAVIEQDDVTTVVYNSMEDMEHVLGQYVVTIEDGDVTVSWSHDGQSTEGELEAHAWGAKQLEILIEMAKDEQGFSRGHQKAQELRAQMENGEITVSIASGDGGTQVTTIPLREIDASIRVGEDEGIAIAKEAFRQEYRLTQAQLDAMEYNKDYAGYTYAVRDGRTICELYFWLHQQEGVYHTEGDGIYRAVIDAQSGEIVDMEYDSALAGNG